MNKPGVFACVSIHLHGQRTKKVSIYNRSIKKVDRVYLIKIVEALVNRLIIV